MFPDQLFFIYSVLFSLYVFDCIRFLCIYMVYVGCSLIRLLENELSVWIIFHHWLLPELSPLNEAVNIW